MELCGKLKNDPDRCARSVAIVVHTMINSSITNLSMEDLRQQGLQADPFRVPVDTFIRSLLNFCGPNEIIVGLLYCRRLLGSTRGLLRIRTEPSFTKYNCHRLLFVGCLLANIILSDRPLSLRVWAQRVVWSKETIFDMKHAALHELDWRLFVPREEFLSAVSVLEDLTRESPRSVQSIPQSLGDSGRSLSFPPIRSATPLSELPDTAPAIPGDNPRYPSPSSHSFQASQTGSHVWTREVIDIAPLSHLQHSRSLGAHQMLRSRSCSPMRQDSPTRMYQESPTHPAAGQYTSPYYTHYTSTVSSVSRRSRNE
eukprot:Rmarinus@m.15992